MLTRVPVIKRETASCTEQNPFEMKGKVVLLKGSSRA